MRATLLLSSVLLVPALASAQSDLAAGLFTKARHLPLVSQSVSVDIAAGEAIVQLIQVFHNDGADIGQADYRMHLPAEAAVVGFGFWQKGRFLSASLKEKNEAKAAHHKAASEGRATGLLKKEERVHSFSVYPLVANEQKQIEVTLRLPVAREMGRSHLRLPLDEFLGQPKVNTSVLIDVETEDPLEEIGVDGASRRVVVSEVARRERWAQVGFSADESVELWWVEKAPPLLIRADTVALPDEPRGARGLQIRIVLNDAGEWHAPYESVDVLVDASFSMRRKHSALSTLLGRIFDQASTPVTLHAVGEDVTDLGNVNLDEAMSAVMGGELGHSSEWQAFADTVERLGCSARRRCVVITDPQVPGLDAGTLEDAAVLFLGDANELSTFADILGEEARTFQIESDSRARLFAMADETVLPVLDVVRLEQGGRELELLGHQHRRVAEGGMLRLFATVDTAEPISVTGRVGGRDTEHRLVPQRLDTATRAGAGVRRGVYRQVLVNMMAKYRDSLDVTLKEQIVALSLREEIPTAFTSLQVDDPELSLFAIKPGDPVLTVHDEPHLETVVAWYPYGVMRRLVQHPTTGVYSDRFLVPRGWSDRLYRVDVFKHFTDGSVRREDVWYQLDQSAPAARLHWDRDQNLMRIESDEVHGVGSVAVHLDDGTVRTLSPVGDTWIVPTRELGTSFTVVVRDRAGNRSGFRCRLEGGSLTVEPERTKRHAQASALATDSLPTSIVGGGERGFALHRDGLNTELVRPGKPTLRFQAQLRSLWLTAFAAMDRTSFLFGTRGGDLVALTCTAEYQCTAEPITDEFAHHPVTGLEPINRSRVLVGVLGRGLYDLAGTELTRSRIKVGSAFITDMLRSDGEIFIATAYNGLWRTTGSRARRTSFPHKHVAWLRDDTGLVVYSGYGEWLREGRNRFRKLGTAIEMVASGSPDIMGAVRYDEQVLVVGYDNGLYRLVGDMLEPVILDLGPAERRINAIEIFDDAIWLGTKGGLLRLEPGSCEVGIERYLSSEVFDLAVGDDRLAIATSRGLFITTGAGAPERVDQQRGIANRSFMSVAWHRGMMFAGGMEGLFWLAPTGEAGQLGTGAGFDTNWVTALLTDGDRVLVGTYSDGVYSVTVDGGLRARAVPGLEHQWVPYHSIRRIDDSVWIGGLGMAPVRWRADDITAIDVPVRDVNDFLPVDSGVLMSTSNGPVVLKVGDTRVATK